VLCSLGQFELQCSCDIRAELTLDECYAVRTELTNDHKALTKAMDALLQQLHALQKTQNGHAQSHSRTSAASALGSKAAVHTPAAAAPSQQIHSRPFARIDEVSLDSPASAAGLQVSPILPVQQASRDAPHS